MIPGGCSQAADTRVDALVCVAGPSPKRGREPIVGGRAVLKIHGGGQSMRINRAVYCGGKTGDIRCSIRGKAGGASRRGCDKSAVAAVSRSAAVDCHDPKMIRRICS